MFDIEPHINDPNPHWWLKSVPEPNDWSDINILRFLQLYQRHPALWNVHSSEYKSPCMRLRSYNHIVELLNLRGVGVKECIKLVENLKKRYVEEKEVKRRKCERRPVWFEIVRGIVRRILEPDEDSNNCSCCKQCCGCPTPSSTTVSSDYQACQDCCANQNLRPTCRYYKKDADDKSEDEESEESNRCNLQNVECYTICNDEVKVVLLNIGAKKKKKSDCGCKSEEDEDSVERNSDCDCKSDSVDRNSDCDCKSESTKKSSGSRSDCSCCKSDSIPQVPSCSDDKSCSCLSSSSSSSDDCLPSCNTIPSVSTVAQFCIQPMPEPSPSTSTSSSASLIDTKSPGIFTASQRFRGKRISLVDAYTTDDRLIAPRMHRARCCCGADMYPVQVEL